MGQRLECSEFKIWILLLRIYGDVTDYDIKLNKFFMGKRVSLFIKEVATSSHPVELHFSVEQNISQGRICRKVLVDSGTFGSGLHFFI